MYSRQLDERPASVGSVADAERLVARAVAAATSADGDSRVRILQTLLDQLTETDSLEALCRELKTTGRYAEYAYRHNNGFFVLFLTNPEIGFQSRVHIWLPGRTSPERPHRHRMAFVSRVVAGELTSIHFERCALGEPAPSDALYEETIINAPARTNFDAPDAEFQPQQTVVLREICTRHYRAGDAYYFPAAEIHRVVTPPMLSSPNITLTVWDIPFQESIAYEPRGSADTAPARKQVQRLSASTFSELWEVLLGTLEASRQGGGR